MKSFDAIDDLNELLYPWEGEEEDEGEKEKECADNDHPPYGVDQDGKMKCFCGQRIYETDQLLKLPGVH